MLNTGLRREHLTQILLEKSCFEYIFYSKVPDKYELFVFTHLLFVPMFCLVAFKYFSNVLEGTY